MNHVLLLGFAPIQIRMARKLIALRGLESHIHLADVRVHTGTVSLYVVNGDDAAGVRHYEQLMLSHPRPALSVGARPVAGIPAHAPGPFGPLAADRLVAMLRMDAHAPKVVPFPAAARVRKPEILIVDPSEAQRRALVRKLAEFGQAADVAGRSEDALALLQQRSYRLVLLELSIPGLSGPQLCGRIRASALHGATPVYIVTARDGMVGRLRASIAGATGLLAKPLADEQIRELIDQHVAPVPAAPAEGPESTIGSSFVALSPLSPVEQAMAESKLRRLPGR